VDLPFARRPGMVYDGDFVRRKHGHVAFLKEYHPPGVLQQGRNIRGDKVFACAQAHYQGRVLPGRYDPVRVIRGDNAQRVGAAHNGQRFLDRGEQVSEKAAR